MIIQLFVERDKMEEILQDLYELAGERDWWKNEPRNGYADEHAKLLERIEFLKGLIEYKAANKELLIDAHEPHSGQAF